MVGRCEGATVVCGLQTNSPVPASFYLCLAPQFMHVASQQVAKCNQLEERGMEGVREHDTRHMTVVWLGCTSSSSFTWSTSIGLGLYAAACSDRFILIWSLMIARDVRAVLQLAEPHTHTHIARDVLVESIKVALHGHLSPVAEARRWVTHRVIGLHTSHASRSQLQSQKGEGRCECGCD